MIKNTSIIIKKRTSAITEASLASIYDEIAPNKTLAHASGSTQYPSDKKLNHVISASLTQEVNRAGQLSLEVSKDMLDLYPKYTGHSEFIEVKSPYILEGNVGQGEDYGGIWRGIEASETAKGNTISMVWEGDMTLLDRRPMKPYATSSKVVTRDFIRYVITGFNAAQSEYGMETNPLGGYYTFGVIAGSIATGEAHNRSSINTSTYWKELEQNVFSKRPDVYISIISVPNTIERKLYFRPFSTEPLDFISLNDFAEVNQTQNISEQPAAAIVYGNHKNDESYNDHGLLPSWYIPGTYPDGDAGRYSNNATSSKASYGSSGVTTVEYNASNALVLFIEGANILNGMFADAFSFQAKIRPDVAKHLWLGEVYAIEDRNTGRTENYRLTKRTIDLLNPANSTYTFGKVSSFVLRKEGGSDVTVMNNVNSDSTVTDNDALGARQGQQLNQLLNPAYSDRISITTGNSNIVLYRNNSYRIGNFIMLNLVLQIKATVANGDTLFTLPNANIQATQEVPLVSASDRTVFMGAAKLGDTVTANGSILGTTAGIYYFINGMIYAPGSSS